MASMDIGGDDSVAWTANHDKALVVRHELPRRTLHQAHPHQDAMNERMAEGFAEGRDPVDTNGKVFRISIKLPADAANRDSFLTSLKNAVPDAVGRVNIELPIEAKNDDQIHIEWAF